MDELCGGGKAGVAFSLSAFTYSMFCHPERVFCAKDLCSWTVPLRWTGSIAGLPKTSRSQVDRILDPKRDITLSSLQRAAALVGQRVVIELV
jgi:hypothetical protein